MLSYLFLFNDTKCDCTICNKTVLLLRAAWIATGEEVKSGAGDFHEQDAGCEQRAG
tara:strand:+ start:4163 stop:4330 length:168 start_codon:yes stop_codon:yes gene_type:complete